eukprot:GHVL01024015.1.p2 GENE.GHVL01024015.1~~GHVL01024015.1.p2  ORF type:complete len:122 (+),score=14.84 GHVL01024015.1:550-915(+)
MMFKRQRVLKFDPVKNILKKVKRTQHIFFLNMEKVKANLKFMDRLIDENGSQITTQKGILQEQVRFYNNVFDKNRNCVEENAESKVLNLNIPQLKYVLETDFTVLEIGRALYLLKNIRRQV